MKLLWSGISEGTVTLNDSPENYRMIHATSSYEQGRIIIANFCPAAAGIQNPIWSLDIGNSQVLTFQGTKHKTVKVNDSGSIRFALESIYGQL